MGLFLSTTFAAAATIINCENSVLQKSIFDVGVVRCYDGDTCTLKTGEKIRLAGIDAPEKKGTLGGGGQAGAEDAAKALQSRVVGKTVGLIQHGKDRYGRVVGEFCEGKDSVNIWLVEKGFARVYRGKESSKTIDKPQFEVAEEKAKSASLGIWASGQAEDPAEYRKKIRKN